MGVGQKRIYYLSMEYLPGRLLRDALTNLGIFEATEEACHELGVELREILEVEPDPGLGNGGLGRLASCFLDSMATLGIAGTGYGIFYDYGIFRQEIVDGRQEEVADSWLHHGTPWEVARTESKYRVRFGGRVAASTDATGRTRFHWLDTQDVYAVAHDLPVAGYKNGVVNTLRLWAAEPLSDFDLARFNEGDHEGSVVARGEAENISRVLYPNDNVPDGKELRLKQQYFFVACLAARHPCAATWLEPRHPGTDLPDQVALQLNDTHPAIAVAELMRLLVDREGTIWAGSAPGPSPQGSIAYTNHTLLAGGAWRRWPVGHVFARLLAAALGLHSSQIDQPPLPAPRCVVTWPGDDRARRDRMSIIQPHAQGQVHMAHLAVVGSFTASTGWRRCTAACSSAPGCCRTSPRCGPGALPGTRPTASRPRRWLLQLQPAA